ncbi:MAG: ATP-grasp domain-containing protein [Candidatus Bathyarchaeales archaeon]
MSIGLLCDYLEIDEIGIKATAEKLGINLTYIPFRKISIKIGDDGYKVRSKGKDYSETIGNVKVVLNRIQSKNRRLMAASFLEALDKPAINPLPVEFLCFSKLRTLLYLHKNGVKIPKTVFIPCDPHEKTKDGTEVRSEEEIAGLIQQELGESMIVVKPDAGTHGRGVELAENREELLKIIGKNESSIINPVGVFVQEFVKKWFYDLRIIVAKEKGKTPYCHPKAMARASFKDFRTNTSLGNFVFDVDLPPYIRDTASKCGKIIGKNCEAWLIALDAMVSIGENKVVDDEYVKAELEKLAAPFETVKKARNDPAKKRGFSSWNRMLEESFQNYKCSEAYENVRKVINESVEKNKYNVLFHEANSCPEFWEQTRLATGANLAEYLLKCAKSMIT